MINKLQAESSAKIQVAPGNEQLLWSCYVFVVVYSKVHTN